ncbi:DinB family protein [Streptomyces sp. NPDC058463]|uniref:DinB family protein n=1 Tax=Streptomyces sp. NPDC058463 TaxID=3346510 RepID=UPI00364BF124
MTPETEGILTALRDARRLLLITVQDITDTQVAERSTVSELTLGGILNHLTQGERVWTHIMTDTSGRTPDGMWDMTQYLAPEGATVDSLRAAYAESARATDEAYAKADPDAEVRLPEAPWEPGVVHHWPVRRILLHLLQETAQHAGHADIIRESLDGASSTARRVG